MNRNRRIKLIFTILSVLLLLTPIFAKAQVVITEVMYNLPGADVGKEWIEVQNQGDTVADLTTYKISKDAEYKHSMVVSKGGEILIARSFAVIAKDPTKFLIDWPQFSGQLFGVTSSSSLSVIDDGTEKISLWNGNKLEDSMAYTASSSRKIRADGGGDSLQKVNGSWIEAKPTPGEENKDNIIVSPVSDKNSSVTSFSHSNDSGSVFSGTSLSSNISSFQFPVDPQIFSKAQTSKKTIVAGGMIPFDGKAWGLKKEPLDDRARFVWNFGDGDMREGQNVTHVFKYPGKYVVVLDVGYMYYSASSRLVIVVGEANVSISKTEDGVDGFVEIRNDSNDELDISGWLLKNVATQFQFPENTIILPNTSVRFSNEVTKLNSNTGNISLFYPTGKMVLTFNNLSAANSAHTDIAVATSSTGDESVSANSLNKNYLGDSVNSNYSRGTTVHRDESFADAKVNAADVYLSAATTSAAAAMKDIKGAPDGRNFSMKWFLSLGALSLSSIVGVFLFKPKESLADQFDIIENNDE